MTNKGTYDRKYYLHRQIKKAGYRLELEKKSRTISIETSQVEHAKSDKYVAELQAQHSYGVQLKNPIMEMTKSKYDE